MTPKQRFSACVALAPNFRVEVQFVTFQTTDRVMVWYGRRPADIEPMTAGIAFPPGNDFEATFDELLTRALAALSV